MILIGQYDSPFVRRVAIALALYDMPFEHKPWSVFGDADRIARYSPLRRAPTLVLDDGEALVDSATIIDALDHMVGPERALYPPTGAERRSAMRVAALASGAADKGVSLLYELRLHERATPAWVARCRSQVTEVLDLLERERAERPSPFWLGGSLGHADIMVACALRLLSEAHDGLIDWVRWRALEAHSRRCEALPVFQAQSQPYSYTPPKG